MPNINILHKKIKSLPSEIVRQSDDTCEIFPIPQLSIDICLFEVSVENGGKGTIQVSFNGKRHTVHVAAMKDGRYQAKYFPSDLEKPVSQSGKASTYELAKDEVIKLVEKL